MTGGLWHDDTAEVLVPCLMPVGGRYMGIDQVYENEERFSTPADTAGIDNRSPPFPLEGGVENTILSLPKFT